MGPPAPQSAGSVGPLVASTVDWVVVGGESNGCRRSDIVVRRGRRGHRPDEGEGEGERPDDGPELQPRHRPSLTVPAVPLSAHDVCEQANALISTEILPPPNLPFCDEA